MRSASFVLLLLAAPAVLAQADEPAWQVLDDCVESVDPDVIGMTAIEAACPGLAAALEELGVAPFLSESQRELIGLPGLMSVQSLVQRYRDVPDTGAVDVDSLRSVLGSLQQPARVEKDLSWFERFSRWLRRALGNETPQSSDSWLSRWLSEHPVPETARLVLVYGSMLLVVGLAIAVIVNEWRVARKSRRKSQRAQSLIEPIRSDGKVASSITDLDAAARADRPSLMLRILVATLVKTGRLRSERSLTHRELSVTAKFDAAEQRECFHRIAALAERVLYGGGDIPGEELDHLVQAGRALNSQLSGAAS